MGQFCSWKGSHCQQAVQNGRSARLHVDRLIGVHDAEAGSRNLAVGIALTAPDAMIAAAHYGAIKKQAER